MGTKPQFAENHIYHVYNRGVEKRNTFLNSKDYLRMIHDLYEFNDENSALNVGYHLNSKSAGSIEVEPQYLKKEKKKRKLLVEILAFTLMPNHFHLILRQKRDGGIVKFMQKLGTGYTMYFNKKYKRVGGLFQGRYKAVLLENDSHFIYLPFYVHANPLKIYRGSTSIDKMFDFLKDYRWSSFLDYIGIKNFPSVTSREFLLEFFNGTSGYIKEMKNFLKFKLENHEKIKDVAIDEKD